MSDANNDFSRPGMPDLLADAFPLAPAPSRQRATVTPGDGGGLVPCPCACACGNPTDKTFTEIESSAALRFLRCEPCGSQQHFGPRWNKAAAAGAVRTGGAGDETYTGKRTRQQFVVHKPTRAAIDPEEEEWERQAARDDADQRWRAATERWLANLPERWVMPRREGETIVPQVQERIDRLAKGMTHGTSLICLGPFGTGKTWVAYTYAREAVERRLLWPSEIRVGTEAELVEPLALAAPWEMSEKANALLRPSLKLLIIDDVGAMASYKSVENRYAAWGKIANWAYEHKRAVVLTTNKSLGPMPQEGEDAGKLDRLISWIGPMAYERFKHMVGQNQVFRDENKRAEQGAAWEAEYQAMVAASDNSHVDPS